MRKELKETTNAIFTGYLAAWLIIAAISVFLMLFTGKPAADYLAAVIMALFMLLPVRDWMYRFFIWVLNRLSSDSDQMRKRLRPYLTYKDVTAPDGAERRPDEGVFRAIRMAIFVICLILALLWLTFKEVSFNCVYAFLRTFELTAKAVIRPIDWILYILLVAGYVYLIYWFVGQWLEAKRPGEADDELKFHHYDGSVDWSKAGWRVAVMLGGFYGKIILTGLLFRFTATMMWSKIVFWTVVVGFPILIYNIWAIVQRLKRQ